MKLVVILAFHSSEGHCTVEWVVHRFLAWTLDGLGWWELFTLSSQVFSVPSKTRVVSLKQADLF